MMCALVSAGPSLCVNEAEYEENYGDSYDNEISEDQQEGEFCLFVPFCLS